MKKTVLSAILIILTGCDYELPLSQTADSSANPALAGIWTGSPSEGKTAALEINISGTGYNVAYTEDSSTITFKGFGISAAGLDLIQLELQNADTRSKYLFVKYELTPGGIDVYRLNPEVISAKCRTAEELMNDIAAHRNNPLLFKEPLKFVRSAAQ